MTVLWHLTSAIIFVFNLLAITPNPHKLPPMNNKPSNDKPSEEKPTPLFRAEAIRHRTRALFGDVVLAAPLSTWLITGLLVMILVGLIVFGVLVSVEIDGDNIPIWRWILGRNQ